MRYIYIYIDLKIRYFRRNTLPWRSSKSLMKFFNFMIEFWLFLLMKVIPYPNVDFSGHQKRKELFDVTQPQLNCCYCYMRWAFIQLQFGVFYYFRKMGWKPVIINYSVRSELLSSFLSTFFWESNPSHTRLAQFAFCEDCESDRLLT